MLSQLFQLARSKEREHKNWNWNTEECVFQRLDCIASVFSMCSWWPCCLSPAATGGKGQGRREPQVQMLDRTRHQRLLDRLIDGPMTSSIGQWG